MILEILTSLRTSIWFLCALIVMLFAGAFVMPVRSEFQSIHSVPMFQWIGEQDLGATWWLWVSIALIAALSANTLSCSIDSLIRKRKTTQWLLLISPQIIHIGFLFMLLAHLLSATSGFKRVAGAWEGMVLKLPDDTMVRVKTISISIDPYGYMRDWAVDIEYLSERDVTTEERLMPNRPSFRKGVGIYVKDLQAFPYRAVLLEVSREPGAVWALVGGVLFTVGTVALLALKMRRDVSP